MRPGENGANWRKPATARQGLAQKIACRRPGFHGLGLVLFSFCPFLASCASGRGEVEKNLMGQRSEQHGQGVVENYLVRFPDVLQVEVQEQAEKSGQCTVGLDGCIVIPPGHKLRVEGRTLPDIARAIADLADLPPERVQVRVAEYRSQPLFLQGQVVGWQRSIPYQGQETVLDVLQRVGGITPEAAPAGVYVVRSHVTEGQRPEIFHVDLDAIVLKKDLSTNIRLLPYDQIFVGETRQARIIKCIPPWLQPLFHTFFGSRPSTPEGQGVPMNLEKPLRTLPKTTGGKGFPSSLSSMPGLPSFPR